MSETQDAPERIWAWVYADPWGNELRWFEWENHEPEPGEYEYIRAELVQAKDAEIARLRAELDAAQATPASWPNGCDFVAPNALRYIAENDRPPEGESPYNSAHLHQIADDIELMASRQLYTFPAIQPGDLAAKIGGDA